MYKVSGFQELVPGSNVTQIIGIDRNPQDDRVLRYGFVPNDALADDMSRFNIDPETGVITVKGRLDREAQQVYEVGVILTEIKQVYEVGVILTVRPNRCMR